MFNALSIGAFASALLFSFAISGWAAEEKKAAPEEKKAAPPAKAEKMAEPEKKPEAGKMAGGSEETRKVQEALKAKGNDPGPIDGRMGPKTRAAIKSFQEANGLKGTGQLDSQTAEKLGVAKAGTTAGKETKAAKEPMSKEPAKEPTTKEKTK
jgi:peptidoglycan hydrolase-like protein with peptidoglycan-binding domain